MSENSFLWQSGLGDAIGENPYTADKWAENYRILLTDNSDNVGVIKNYLNELGVAGSGGATVSIESGGAIVHGTPYLHTEQSTLALEVSVTTDRFYFIVLRKDWAERTVRIDVRAGSVLGGVPTLVQVNGVIWEIPLASIEVAQTTGTVTVTDTREYVFSPFAEGSRFGQAWEIIETIKPDGTLFATFSDIPSTYKHLRISGLISSNSVGAGSEQLDLYLNGDTTFSNYNRQRVSKMVGAAPPQSVVAVASNKATLRIVKDIPAFSTMITFDIFNYTDAIHKNIIAISNSFFSSLNIDDSVEKFRENFIWKNTDVITSITIELLLGDNYSPGSKLSLWGIRG